MESTRVEVKPTQRDFFGIEGLMATSKRKQWTEESMSAAFQTVMDGKGLRETSRIYNVPVEMLRRRVNGSVELGCRPGPATILTDVQKDMLREYIIKMADMGYGLTREDVQRLAFSIAEKSHHKHPFRDGKAGRGWFDGFKARHPQLSFRTPQALSYSRAISAKLSLLIFCQAGRDIWETESGFKANANI